MSESTVSDLQLPDSEEPSSGGNRRVMLLVGGAVGLVVLMALGYFLFFSGGGDTEELAPVPQGQVSTPKPTPSPSGKPTTAPATFDDEIGRDPFQPLAAEATPVTVPTDAPTDAPTDDPSSQPTSGSTGGTPQPTPSATNTPAPTQYQVTVQSVNATGSPPTATLVINGAVYKGVKKGDLLPDGQVIQLQVVQIYSDPSGKYVQLRLGSGSVETIAQGKSSTFRFES